MIYKKIKINNKLIKSLKFLIILAVINIKRKKVLLQMKNLNLIYQNNSNCNQKTLCKKHKFKTKMTQLQRVFTINLWENKLTVYKILMKFNNIVIKIFQI